MAPIPFEPGAIRMLAKLMSETGLTEIEMAEKDRRIRVVRGVAQAPMQQVVVPHAAPLALAAAAAPAIDPGAVLSPIRNANVDGTSSSPTETERICS